jgi:hypothetical protein
MIQTYSKFYYGFEVSSDNRYVDFKEGAPELTATLNIGSYSMTEYAAELARALNAAGALDYTVTVSRVTRKFTVAASGTFQLLVTSGSHFGTSAFSKFGFTGVDRTGTNTYTGDTGGGSEYRMQARLQSYTPSSNWQGYSDASVSKSASGRKEVVGFGTEKFIEMNIKWVTDIMLNNICPTDWHRDSISTVADLRTFMQFITTVKPVEFMEDEDVPGTYETLVIEKTPAESKGTQYKLIELYDKGLVGFFETGTLTFRVLT